MFSRRLAFVTVLFASTLVAIACGDSDSGAGAGPTVEPSDDAAAKKDGANKDGASEDDSSTTDASKDAAKSDAAKSDADLDANGGDGSDGATDAGWPDCATQPLGAVTKTLPQIWSDNASAPTRVWIDDVVVTAISRGGCTAGQACQLYVQSPTSFASLAQGAHAAIKVFVSAATSTHFTGIQVGDRVDVSGWAWRYNLDGQNEVLVQVNAALPGCMKKSGTAAITPIAVSLAELTHASYETYGPLLVSLAATSGKAQASATETFGLYPTGFDGGFDAGAEIVSLSPFFLPNATFSGTSVTTNVVNAFSSLTGVFGIFTPAVPDAGGPSTTYLELCPRTSSDIVK